MGASLSQSGFMEVDGGTADAPAVSGDAPPAAAAAIAAPQLLPPVMKVAPKRSRDVHAPEPPAAGTASSSDLASAAGGAEAPSPSAACNAPAAEGDALGLARLHTPAGRDAACLNGATSPAAAPPATPPAQAGPAPPPVSASPRPTYPWVLTGPTADLHSRYHLWSELGRGQFGVVTLCSDKVSGAQLACKTVQKAALRRPQDLYDLRAEIHILRHLAGDPAVVHLVEVLEDESALHMIMECCTGGILYRQLAQLGALPEATAADLFRAMLTVTARIHAAGVLHRDLKPENFLLARPGDLGSLRLADFGLATFHTPGQVHTSRVGSPFYVAPEVLARSYGPAADCWSLGVILYILLSGQFPFYAETAEAIFAAVRAATPDFTGAAWARVSPDAKQLVRAMLVKEPSQRLTLAQAMAHPWMIRHELAAAAAEADEAAAAVARRALSVDAYLPRGKLASAHAAQAALVAAAARAAAAAAVATAAQQKADEGSVATATEACSPLDVAADCGTPVSSLYRPSLERASLERPPASGMRPRTSLERNRPSLERNRPSVERGAPHASRPSVGRRPSHGRPSMGTPGRATGVAAELFETSRCQIFLSEFERCLQRGLLPAFEAAGDADSLAEAVAAAARYGRAFDRCLQHHGAPEGPYFFGRRPSVVEGATVRPAMRLLQTLAAKGVPLVAQLKAAGCPRAAAWLGAVAANSEQILLLHAA